MEYKRRIEILKDLKRRIVDNQDEFVTAMRADMKRPELELLISEIFVVLSEIDLMIKRLGKWMKPQKVTTPLGFLPGKSFIWKEPKGHVLVIGTWNYPLQLSLVPVIGALAAGNRVTLKPSEVAPNTSSAINRILGDWIHELTVIEGGVSETTELLQKRFDHIFFTGGAAVAKIVMSAASKYLTPVTLELGGKSPAVVVDHVDQAARRIAWGKFFNGGQTCVAPDYVLIKKGLKEKFVSKVAYYIEKFYGKNPMESSDLVSVINDRHFDRLSNLLESATLLYGGESDKATRKIAPTLVEATGSVMEDEIFGNILPVKEFGTIGEATDFINSGEKPLAFYIFSSSIKIQEEILAATSSGGVCINDTLIHLSSHNLPFGGIGNSGIGNYHGKASFDLFTHHRSVMKRALWSDIPMRYPPYTDGKLKIMKFAQKLGLLS